ncbi:MAG: hypothetical protein ACXWTX_02580 [Gallionella sp.]
MVKQYAEEDLTMEHVTAEQINNGLMQLGMGAVGLAGTTASMIWAFSNDLSIASYLIFQALFTSALLFARLLGAKAPTAPALIWAGRKTYKLLTGYQFQ